MAGLVVNGKEYSISGISIKNFLDDCLLRFSKEDGRARKTDWISQIIIHTTKGLWPQHTFKSHGASNFENVEKVARWWKRSDKSSAAPLIVDGTNVYCTGDLATDCLYHAGHVNEWSIGIEMYQYFDGAIEEGTLDTTVKLVDWLCAFFGVQKQYHSSYSGKPLERLSTAKAARNVVGVFGHRDVATNRGRGDPGDLIFSRLDAAGYRNFYFNLGEDLEHWMDIQESLGMSVIDGIPGPNTVAALKEAGYVNGIWVPEPEQKPKTITIEGDIKKIIIDGKEIEF